jgi:aspartate carbamoyltransferase catalytic subunit
VAADVDVLYQTRIQKERFQDRPEDYEKARGKYIVDEALLKVLPAHSVIMHPLPRVDEVSRIPQAAALLLVSLEKCNQSDWRLVVALALVSIILIKSAHAH